MTNYITVQFAKKFPGKLIDFTLNGSRTLRALLEANGLLQPGETVREMDVRVNGQKVQLEHQLSDNDKILIFSLIKGNQEVITIKIGRVPGPGLIEVVLPNRAHIRTALEAAEIVLSEDEEIFTNDEWSFVDRSLNNEDTVVIKKKALVSTESDEDEDNYNREEETPSQKLYARAQFLEDRAANDAGILKRIAGELDRNPEFERLMYEIFGN